MEPQRRGIPWGTVLVLLTILALSYYWFEGTEDGPAADPGAGVATSPPDPFVRRTPGWAPVGRAVVTPGTQTLTEGGGQCTTNFVFTDAAGGVYLGQAAHCARAGEGENGCRAASAPLGTVVTFHRGVSPVEAGRTLASGRLAYSSWLTMQGRKERDAAACAFNDFALVKVDGDARSRVNPSMPHWGGPTGLAEGTVYGTERVFGIGRSSLRRPGSPYSQQSGITLPDEPERAGWSHTFIARSPGIPGDSGSGYLDVEGRALGTLSTLVISTALANSIGDLRQELAYARRHSGIRGLRLELGTAPFNRAVAEAAR